MSNNVNNVQMQQEEAEEDEISIRSCNYCKLELINTNPFQIIPFIILGFCLAEIGLHLKNNGFANIEIIGITAILILIISCFISLIHFTYGLFVFSFLILSTSILMSSIFLVTSLETPTPPRDLIYEGTSLKWILDAQKNCCGYYSFHDWIHGNETYEGIASCCNQTTIFTCAFDENPGITNWESFVSPEGCSEKLENISAQITEEKIKSAASLLFWDGFLTIDLILFSIWSKYKKVYSTSSTSEPRETVVFG